jgi:hypothetical protein
MATIDQLLNDIDEFENWPFDVEPNAGEPSRGTVETDSKTQSDLVECVLHNRCR